VRGRGEEGGGERREARGEREVGGEVKRDRGRRRRGGAKREGKVGRGERGGRGRWSEGAHGERKVNHMCQYDQIDPWYSHHLSGKVYTNKQNSYIYKRSRE
jgi:hypothetical protein